MHTVIIKAGFPVCMQLCTCAPFLLLRPSQPSYRPKTRSKPLQLVDPHMVALPRQSQSGQCRNQHSLALLPQTKAASAASSFWMISRLHGHHMQVEGCKDKLLFAIYQNYHSHLSSCSSLAIPSHLWGACASPYSILSLAVLHQY